MNNIRCTSAKEALKAASGKGIQNMIDAAADLLENPICMYDLSYNLLAHTENKITDDPLWNELTSLGTFSHETVDFFNTEKFIEAYAKSDCVALMKSLKLKYDRANAIIFDKDGTQLGNICVVACYRPFKDSDFELMEIICDYLSSGLRKSKHYGKMSRVFQETLVSRLIEGADTTTTPYSQTAMNKLYKGLKQNIYIAVIDVIQYENTLTHLVYFTDLFHKINGDFKYFIYLNNIVAIMSTDSPFLSMNRELKELNDFFSIYKIYAGISDSFQNLSELKTYFVQALNALNFGFNIHDGRNIFMFADFRLETFVKDYPDKMPELCHPIAVFIRNYDKEHKTIYNDVLYSYMLCGQNAEKAANVMNIDKEGFCRQLEAAGRIFEIDFANGNTLLGLFCSMKLHAVFSEKFDSPLLRNRK